MSSLAVSKLPAPEQSGALVKPKKGKGTTKTTTKETTKGTKEDKTKDKGKTKDKDEEKTKDKDGSADTDELKKFMADPRFATATVESEAESGDEDDAQDIAERKEQMKGWEHGSAEDYKHPNIPEEVKQLYGKLSPHIRLWWREGKVPDSHRKEIKATNEKIKAINEAFNAKAKEKNSDLTKELEPQVQDAIARRYVEEGIDPKLEPEDEQEKSQRKEKMAIIQKNAWAEILKSSIRPDDLFQFPEAEIIGNINGLKMTIKDLAMAERASKEFEKEAQAEEKAKADQMRLDSRTKIITGGVTFQQALANKGFNVRHCIPAPIMEQFLTLISESEESQKEYEDFAKLLADPTKWQADLWSEAANSIEKFLVILKPGKEVDEDDLDQAKGYIQQVEDANTQLILRNNESNMDVSDHQIPVAKMHELLQYRKRGRDDDMIQECLRVLKEMFTVRGQPTLSELIDVDTTPIRLPAPTGAAARLPTQPLATEAQHAPSARVKPTVAAPKPTSESLFISEEDLDDLFDDSGIDAFDYSSGRTEFGELEATRGKAGNARTSRFILFAGTGRHQHWIVKRGSDLGPGGAEALHANKEFHVNFDLSARKEAMRESPIKGAMIESYDTFVEMPRLTEKVSRSKNGNVIRKDGYVRVTYSDDPEKNTLAKNKRYPRRDWLSRSEIIQLVGKKFWERQEPGLLRKFERRQQAFEYCKRMHLHPDTRKPLKEKDRAEYPWLFEVGEHVDEEESDEESDEGSDSETDAGGDGNGGDNDGDDVNMKGT